MIKNMKKDSNNLYMGDCSGGDCLTSMVTDFLAASSLREARQTKRPDS